jgi:hypothetical protein
MNRLFAMLCTILICMILIASLKGLIILSRSTGIKIIGKLKPSTHRKDKWTSKSEILVTPNIPVGLVGPFCNMKPCAGVECLRLSPYVLSLPSSKIFIGTCPLACDQGRLDSRIHKSRILKIPGHGTVMETSYHYKTT